MSHIMELKAEDLEIKFDILPNFENTSEIAPFKEMIGQDRAMEAIELGLAIDSYGYNIFVSGKSGTGKKSYIMGKLKEYAAKMNTPEDWCYVYNFKDANKPIALRLNPGTAEEFKNDIEMLVESLFEDVPKYFAGDKYERERSDVIDRYQKELLDSVEVLYDEAKKKGFNVKSTNDGFAFIPLKDDEEMTEKDYNELSSEEKEEINSRVSELKILALEVIRKTKLIKKDMNKKLDDMDKGLAGYVINRKIKKLKDKYSYNSKISEYIDDFKMDLIENIEAFMDYEEPEERYDENFYKRYSVNILINNKELTGAPVVYEDTPEYHKLIGIIEYENKQGTLVTDFTMIQPGSLHRANGGFIVIDVMQLLLSYQGWEALKKCLKCKKIFIENLKNQFDIIPLVALKPEEIPLTVKIVLLGSPELYYLLYEHDDEFKELFKIKADFENDFKNDNNVIMKTLGFVSNYCTENSINHITRDGFIEILKYSLRLAENKNYFTANMDKIVDIINQANCFSKNNGESVIDKRHIKASLIALNKRHSLYRDYMLNMYKEGKYLVNVSGYRIGEINALSVIDYGDFVFGKQNRITAVTYAGKEGVVNIERETNMSGNIHDKGVMILSGYMYENYAQSSPIAFNASICFEQLYGGIDGDSASAAELIALMSSLGDIEIKQSIAVTGSINQRGEIQPVGGINEKVEGFYDICKIYGLDGTHGVIIPYSNRDELIIKDEIIDAVRNGKFHIYTVERIEDCFEILCNPNLMKASKKDIMEIINEKINQKLEKYKGGNPSKKKNRDI
ncbi:hypothetical protein Q428_08135 [Fervidicella metallireducens AeB]|uniref:endopeptidase La n=1 Tax=Fervidicella metallireducens AeB TaxID=1403537 RepID=A0A017RUI9_9CLOT|nr:ATP-binding protein [Fervidicella metallireducens]EYE88357.1 hypothetical protein Q428_08135 [Fervidicella metallireducens AeB]